MHLGLGLGITAQRRVPGEGEPEPGLILIDRTAGTNIGSMTGQGGLAAAFDGVTSQAASASAGNTASQSGYVGKTLASPKIFGRAIIYPSLAGFADTINPTVTLTIYGKDGAAPASATDGTIIGTLAPFADDTTERTIDSTDLVNTWDHLWVRLQTSTNANGRIAELVLYEWG